MQLRPRRLSGARRRRRRGSAGGGSGSRPRRANCARSGRISSPAHERGQARRHLRLLRARAPARRRGGRPRPRPRRARAPAARPRRAGRGGRRAAPSSVGGTSTSSPASSAIASISPMKSGLPPAAAAILARSSSGTAAPIRLAASSLLERLEPHRHRPGGAAVEQLRAGHAEQQERGAAGEQRDVLDQVEERLLAPLDVVEHDDERRLLLEQLAERPGDLLRRRPRLRLARAANGSPPPRPDRTAARRAASPPRRPASR